MVTRYPLACKSLASEAAIMPFPNEDDTPPVTKMYFVVLMDALKSFYTGCKGRYLNKELRNELPVISKKFLKRNIKENHKKMKCRKDLKF